MYRYEKASISRAYRYSVPDVKDFIITALGRFLVFDMWLVENLAQRLYVYANVSRSPQNGKLGCMPVGKSLIL